jgi:hypothetical protein
VQRLSFAFLVHRRQRLKVYEIFNRAFVRSIVVGSSSVGGSTAAHASDRGTVLPCRGQIELSLSLGLFGQRRLVLLLSTFFRPSTLVLEVVIAIDCFGSHLHTQA